MDNFRMLFEGKSTDGGSEFGCGMTISAENFETVGKLLADYVLAEAAKHHYEPFRIMQAFTKRACEIAEQNDIRSGIIKPNNLGILKGLKPRK